MARKLDAASEIAKPENLNPALTHFIVVDFGDWGFGSTVKEALEKIPGGKRTRLQNPMQVWHVTPETRLDAAGKFFGHGQNYPVLNESHRKSS
jgi:broad specificity phosphatase PhoE